ncbi:MAG: mobile mystery protein A [Haliscomenobacter sp.]|nr:mobile mystery protein A [Haliscomenobacter sp.]
MNKDQRRLRMAQLDRNLVLFSDIKNLPVPAGGWIHAIRTSLGMSLRQLGKKLNMTPQGVKDIERREAEGALTLQRLREVAAAMHLQLVYSLIPQEQSLEKMIENRALALAKEIVLKTAHTMQLENQGIDQEALREAIQKRAEKIKCDLPRNLWD